MKEDFLIELSSLLEKYNATIWFSCGAGLDAFGRNEDRITVSINDDLVLDTVSDWYLDSNNIKENI